VQIDKTGRDDQACGVENLRVFGNTLGSSEQTGNAAVFNQQVSAGIDLLRRIDHVTVCDQ
jgi:hypothetical protein